MLTRKAVGLTVVLNTYAFLLLLGACRNQAQHEDATSGKYERPDPGHPYFVLDAAKTRMLRDRVSTLKLGETISKAIELVGPPDENYHFSTAKPPTDWKWHYLTYYVTTVGKTPGNVYDRHVNLIFNRQDKLIFIQSNVDGIPSRGDMIR